MLSILRPAQDDTVYEDTERERDEGKEREQEREEGFYESL
jgi:hypothetical protein